MKRIVILLAGLLMGVAAFAQDLDATYAKDLLKSGLQAPDFTLENVDGQPVSLQDFRGRQVVLVFWASWCPDCRAEVPALKALQEKTDPAKVAFVSVSFDRTREAFETYVRNNALGGAQLFDPSGMRESALSAAYHIKWTPSLYLIAPDGTVQLGTVMLDKLVQAME